LAGVALIIFVKNPIAGQVKTRIAASIGNEKALDIYHKLVEHTFNITSEITVNRFVFYSDFIDHDDIWHDSLFEKHLQKGSDLGARMEHAFTTILSQHEKVLIIGSDCKELEVSHIQQSIEKLEHHDLVFGPAEDGGYYLMGMKKLYNFLFQDIIWSGPEVYNVSLERAKENELAIGILPVLSDVDYIEDWEKYTK